MVTENSFIEEEEFMLKSKLKPNEIKFYNAKIKNNYLFSIKFNNLTQFISKTQSVLMRYFSELSCIWNLGQDWDGTGEQDGAS